MSAVCCPNCGSAVFPLQYLTEEERLAARRKTWRESKRRHRRIFGSLKLTWAHRYWLDRYTLDEVREIGSGLTMFDVTA